MIPPEIKKLGPEAEEIYLRALEEGEQKIPYCGLLILGQEQVGKTSLYRQLVGKAFMEKLESTRGIDNNTVDTVDRRVLDLEAWQEKEGTDTGEQFGDAVISMVVPQLPEKPSEGAHKKKEGEVVKEDALMAEIQRINNRLVKLKERETFARVMNPPLLTTPTFLIPHYFPSADVNAHQDPYPLQPFKTPSSPKAQRREERLQPGVQQKDINQGPPAPRLRPNVAEKPPTMVQPPTLPPAPKPKVMEHSLPKLAPQDPTPQREKSATPPPSEPERSVSSGMLNRRQGGRLDSIVKRGKEEFKPIEPELVLNALDFAGQKEYRPMHHCFIRRRAIYVVVFKIPDLLNEDEYKHCRTIEEMRYWIHSIHAHIYPPDESMKGADEKVKRVFLVGTHRGKKLSEENFNKINSSVEKLAMDDRCVNHVCPVKLPDHGRSFFIPVENSVDKENCSGDYLVESGTKPLQEKIKEMCKDHRKLPFLHESHPIKWLKFEEDLKDFSKVKKPPIVKVQEVDGIAADCRITDEDTKNLALHFFHDTGKIVYLSEFYERVGWDSLM